MSIKIVGIGQNTHKDAVVKERINIECNDAKHVLDVCVPKAQTYPIATCITCPFCEAFTQNNWTPEEEILLEERIEYCQKCNIAFSVGGVYATTSDSEDSLYFADGIVSFELDGQEFGGMPIFESPASFLTLLPFIKPVVKQLKVDGPLFEIPPI
jgi:hypothetical protein